MNQRRDSSSAPTGLIAIAVGLVVVLVLAAVYWFAIRDDDKPSTGSSQRTPDASSTQTFLRPGLPFTFDYPAAFKSVEAPDNYVFFVGLGKYDVLDIRRLANEPTSLGRLRSNNKQALSARPDVKIVGEGSDNRGGVDMVTFEVKSTVEGLAVRSKLYYFSLAGVTWQFECASQADRPEVEAACTQALSTFAVVSS